jgi:hypothetical protein
MPPTDGAIGVFVGVDVAVGVRVGVEVAVNVAVGVKVDVGVVAVPGSKSYVVSELLMPMVKASTFPSNGVPAAPL